MPPTAKCSVVNAIAERAHASLSKGLRIGPIFLHRPSQLRKLGVAATMLLPLLQSLKPLLLRTADSPPAEAFQAGD